MGNDNPTAKSPSRQKRVKRLKAYIITFVICIMFVPLTFAIYFGCEVHSLKKELEAAREELNFYLEQESETDFIEASNESLTSDNDEKDAVPFNKHKKETINLSSNEVNNLSLSDEELYDGYKKVYLTFDDGPSPNTDAILDILKSYDVKATFFVVRRDGPAYEKMYRRIVDEGHSLGMHSSSHIYSEIYKSKEDFLSDTENLRNFLYLVTGVESDIYRFPGGSSNRVGQVSMETLAEALHDEGILYFDWNVSSQDATSGGISKDKIVKNVISKIDSSEESIVLFHDLSSKDTTVEALPEIIEYILSKDDTVILPITRETNPISFLSVKR